MERYRKVKGEQENRESETADLLEEIKMVRERMKEVADETRFKDDLYKQLVGLKFTKKSKCVNTYNFSYPYTHTCTHARTPGW